MRSTSEEKPSRASIEKYLTRNQLHIMSATSSEGCPSRKPRRGCKKGGKHISYPQSTWYQLCAQYEKEQEALAAGASAEVDNSSDDEDDKNAKQTKRKMSQIEFLRRQTIEPGINGSHAVTFGRNWKKYKEGKLKNIALIREKSRLYQDVEQRLIEYVQLQKQVGEDEISTWEVLQEKCRQWAQELGHTEFKASPGWLANTLKRYNQLKASGGPKTTRLPTDLLNKGDNNNIANSIHGLPAWFTDFRTIPANPGCFSCPQWEETCKALDQERRKALEIVRALEQEKRESQQWIRTLEKDNKKKDKEIERLKGVVKVSLNID